MKKFKCALISDIHRGWDKDTHVIHDRFFNKLATENPDILFVAGDIGTSKQSEVYRSLQLLRKFLPNSIIYYVVGNHCLWQSEGYKVPVVDWKNINIFEFYRSRHRKRGCKSYHEIIRNHEAWCKEFNIHYLNGTAHELTPNITIMGFPGWYKFTDIFKLRTNDFQYMPENIESAPMHVYLSHKAEKDLEKLLYTPTDNKTVVMMTHFPPFASEYPFVRDNPEAVDGLNTMWCANTKFLSFIAEKADFLLVGHSHKACDFMENGCRVLNAGCGPKNHGYNDPQYLIFELEDK